MRHLKLFENFDQEDIDNLISGFEDLGIAPKLFLKMKFVGISVEDSLSRWRTVEFGVPDDKILRVRILKLEPEDMEPGKESFSKTLQDSVLSEIRKGEFELNPDCKSLVGDSFVDDTLLEIAEKTQTLDEFWDKTEEILFEEEQDELHKMGADEMGMEEFGELYSSIFEKIKPKFWIETEGEKF